MALFRDEKEALRRLEEALQEEEQEEASEEETEEEEEIREEWEPSAPVSRRSRRKSTAYLIIALLEVALVCGLLAYGITLILR